MKIGIFTTGFFAVNKETVKATEHFAYNLATDLSDRKNSVWVFGAKGSQGNFNVVYPKASERQLGEVKTLHEYDCYVAQNFCDFVDFCNKEKIDIIHEQSSELPVTLARYANMPVVCTLHGDRPDSVLNSFYENCVNVSYISPSKSVIKNSPVLEVSTVIPHGINIKKSIFNNEPEDFFISIGRMIPEKGHIDAIEASRRANKSIVVAGYPIDNPESQKYFLDVQNKSESYEKSRFIGKVSRQDVSGLISRAKALVMPIKWDEPFGLVIIEAMAVGTPVIAYDRGAAREIIEDGKTGFIIPPDDIDKFAEAMGKIDTIDRGYCRKHVENNFNIEKMVDSYERYFQKIIGK
jgi:glycosyltransferase involved in cell wall biosynthesis